MVITRIRLASWPRWPVLLAWTMSALTPLSLAAIIWLDHLSRQAGRPELAQFTASALPLALAAVSSAIVGGVLASRRPRHPVGWLLLVLAQSLSASGVAAAYVAYGLVADPGALPAADAVARYVPILIVTALPILSFVLLLTPTGSLPSPRWRWWSWLTGVAPVALVVAMAPARGSLDARVQAENTLVFTGVTGGMRFVNEVALGVTLLALVVAAASLLVRYRRARGTEHEQLRWVAGVAALMSLAAIAALATAAMGLSDLVDWSVGLCVALLPLAIGAAILRYRLYDLDRIISRTVAYGLLTLLLGGGYAVVVLGLGQALGPDSSLVVAVATLAVAAAMGPARRRVQSAVDRRFNRRHYDAARTIAAFSGRLREHVDLDTLTGELIGVVGHTMQPTAVSLWLRPSAFSDGHFAEDQRARVGPVGVLELDRAASPRAASAPQSLTPDPYP